MEAKEIKKEASRNFKFSLIIKFFYFVLAIMFIFILVCVFVDSRPIKTIFVILVPTICFLEIIFYILSPWIISTKFQLKIYLANIIEQTECLTKLKEQKNKEILKNDPLEIAILKNKEKIAQVKTMLSAL